MGICDVSKAFECKPQLTKLSFYFCVKADYETMYEYVYDC